ncbi:MAG: hypothetical protein KGL16_06320 [Acidobacteriota bacterium]|nr:hypothetical protein [Acidobacteriota bacterium]
MTQNVHIRVRFEDQSYWATVEEYPGVFATGDTLEELRESLEEGLALVIEGADPEQRPVHLSPLRIDVDGATDTIAGSELSLA